MKNKFIQKFCYVIVFLFLTDFSFAQHKETVQIPNENKQNKEEQTKTSNTPESTLDKNKKTATDGQSNTKTSEDSSNYEDNQLVKPGRIPPKAANEHGLYWFAGVFIALLIIIFAFT